MAEKTSVGSDVGNSLPSGLLKAGAGLLSFPETIWNLAGHGGAWAERKLGDATGLKIPGLMNSDAKYEDVNIPLLPSYDEAKNYMRIFKNVDGEPIVDYDSKTLPGKMVNTAAEWGLGGGAFTKFQKFPTLMAAGAGATGEAVEGTGVISEGQAWKVGLAVDIIGNISHGVIKPNDAKRLKMILDDLSENGQLDEVQNIINAANEKGIKLTVPEAIAGVTDDTAILSVADNVYATSGGGTIIDKFTKNRFPQLNEANRNFLNENFDIINVDSIDPKIVTNKFVSTLIKGQDDIRIAINNKARQLKDGGWAKFDEGTFNFEVTAAYMKNLSNRIKNGDTASKGLIQENILNKITAQGKTDLSITNLKKIYDDGMDVVKDLKANNQHNKAFQLNAELKLIRTVLDNNQYYKRASEFTVKANKKLSEKMDAFTIGGQVNKIKNLENSMSTIRKVLFSEDVSPLNIQKLSKELNKIDPSLFPEVSGMLFSKNFTKLMNKADDPMIGMKFYNLMMGKNQKLTEQLIKGTASAQGKNVDEAWLGFQKLMTIYKSTGFRATKGSSTAARKEQFEEWKKLGIPLEGVDITKPSTLLEGFKNYLFNSRAEDLATAFTDPNGIEKLIKIANASRWGQISSNMNALFGLIPEEVKEGEPEHIKQQNIIKNELLEKTGVS
tara:strand:- start:417 stop:2420 length:2004 start_codon:yes stop_codon:yes gene_type:complete